MCTTSHNSWERILNTATLVKNPLDTRIARLLQGHDYICLHHMVDMVDNLARRSYPYSQNSLRHH